ncbi:MAG: DegV family protein [Oscillospiraceae bacterium]
MSDYVIFTDSTTDYTEKMVYDFGVRIIPLKFTMEGKTYENTPDGGAMGSKIFYDKLRNGGMSTTTQVNTEQFLAAFRPVLEGGKDILFIGFSSGLSGTFQGSCRARDELKEEFPDRKIYCFDSLSASLGEGLLVYHATELKKSGKDMDFVFDWLKVNALNLCHWFTVDDLHFLKRGGRVSAAAAVVGTMLGIKPVMHMDNEGHLIPVTKVRGRRQSLDALVRKMEETAIKPGEQTVFISHGDCLEDAEYVAAQVKAKMKVKNVLINFVGPVIGSHSGPGTVALFFLGRER